MGDVEEEETRKLEDHYTLCEVLGTGGFSVVQKGISKEDGTEVAIKTLKKHGNPSVSNALVENEIMVMNRIVDEVSPHPNVIHLIDVFEDDTSIHLVLELCSGGELFDRIVQQERYSEAGAAAVIRQIASGLCSLHAAKIAHRDLKPENCLFQTRDQDSPLKIMDFGLSYIEGETSPLVGLFGSIDYVSPESLSRRESKAAGDMWSLGVILYILLCGYPPFHALNNRAKQQLILNASFDFDEYTWKSISQSAKQLVTSLLTVDPSKRPTAAELLLHPWVKGDAAKQEPMEPEVCRRLLTFNARRKFRAAAYASIVSNQLMLRTKALRKILGGFDTLNEAELKDLHTHFKRISSNGTSVTLPEFEEVLRAMNMGSLVPIAHRVFEVFDNDKNGAVDMREIVCGLAAFRKSQGDEALRLCFKMYDADDSGFISKDELAAMLRALPEDYLPPDILEPGILDEFFDRMDANCDGRLSFDEFRQAIHADHFLVDALLQPARGETPSARPPPKGESPMFRENQWDRL
eukprot:TRINITY_DN32785_c0_g1_i1.p1 TRINITY_DN32785_c0_g1~~TRINITY_DN32785_c0_g1_i1.p1  ORF type:complete len:521 (-),score=42.17 TRINITY_DN32785_c0_g1_i1:344-1906(-)